jgi:hypothetical protein
MEAVMTLFDEGLNFAVVSLAFLCAGLPFLAIWIRDTQWPTWQHQSHTKGNTASYKKIVPTLVLALGIMTAQSASAQNLELYAVSTGNGVEFYQVPSTLKPLNFPGTSNGGSLLTQQTSTQRFLDPSREDGLSMGNKGMLTSGFQTTLTGRVLKVAGRVDWQVEARQEMVRYTPNLRGTGLAVLREQRLSPLKISKVTEAPSMGNY